MSGLFDETAASVVAARSQRWRQADGEVWSSFDWLVAVGGELGEAMGAALAAAPAAEGDGSLCADMCVAGWLLGEAMNAVKKRRRIEGGFANVNVEDGRFLADVAAADAVAVGALAALRDVIDRLLAERFPSLLSADVPTPAPPGHDPAALPAELADVQCYLLLAALHEVGSAARFNTVFAQKFNEVSGRYGFVDHLDVGDS